MHLNIIKKIVWTLNINPKDFQFIIYCRKQNKETLKAVRDQDFKLAHKLEVKKLEILLQQVSQSNNDESDDEK